MKKVHLLLGIVAVFAISLFNSCGPKELDPVTYNDSVLYYYTLLDNQIAEFDEAIWNTDLTVEELQDEYDMVMDIYNKNYKILNEIKPLKNDEWFHKAVIEFYDLTKATMEGEFKKIMDFYSKEWDDSFGPQIEDLEATAVDKIIKGEDNVIESQKKFADKYGLTLY